MAGETEVQGIALGLGIDVSPWSSGIAHARGEWEAFRADVSKGLNIPGGLADIFGSKGGAISPTISPKFQVSRGAVQQMRVQINQELRQLNAGGEAVSIPVKLGRVPFGAMRAEISAGIGEVPITVRVAGVSGAARSSLTALMAEGGQTVGQAVATQQRASARIAAPIPKRAMGGPVWPGQWTMVGEKGPELLKMGTGGHVYPEQVLKKYAAEYRQAIDSIMAHARRIPREIYAGPPKEWYSIAHAQALGDLTDLGRTGLGEAGLGVFSVTSPGLRWPANRAIARRILRTGGFPRGAFEEDVPGYSPIKVAPGYGYGNWQKGVDVAKRRDTSLISGPKVVPFHGAVTGRDPEGWVLDARQARISTPQWQKPVVTAPPAGSWQRVVIEAAHEATYPELRRMWNLQNRTQAQAILWSGEGANVHGYGADLGHDWEMTKTGVAIPRHPGLVVPFHRRRGGRVGIESAKDVRIRSNKLGLNAIMQSASVSQRYRGLTPFSADSSGAMDVEMGLVGEPEDTWYFDAMARARGHMAGGGQTFVAPRGRFRQVDAGRFHSAISAAAQVVRPTGRRVGETVTVHPLEDYTRMRTFLGAGGQAGYAVTPEGDLVSVFNVGGPGFGSGAVKSAIRHGARTLDAFDEISPTFALSPRTDPRDVQKNLPNFYAKFGFREYGRQLWDPQYAPEGWGGGDPDVVYMRRGRRPSTPRGQLMLPGFADGGLIRGIQSAFPRARLDLTRFPDKDLRLLLDAAIPLAEKYPLTASRLKDIGFDRTQRAKTVDLGYGRTATSAVMATTYSPQWDLLHFDEGAPLINPRNLNNSGVASRIMFQRRAVNYARRARLSKGPLPIQGSLVDPSFGGLFTHEFGHAVDYMHGIVPRYSVPESTVSQYAQTNRNENFAELFTGAERGRFLGHLQYQVNDLLDRISAREKYLVQPGKALSYEERRLIKDREALLGRARGGRVPKSSWAYGASNPLVGRLLDKAMADQGYDYKGGQFNRDSTGLGLRDPRHTIPWAWMPWQKNAKGGQVFNHEGVPYLDEGVFNRISSKTGAQFDDFVHQRFSARAARGFERAFDRVHEIAPKALRDLLVFTEGSVPFESMHGRGTMAATRADGTRIVVNDKLARSRHAFISPEEKKGWLVGGQTIEGSVLHELGHVMLGRGGRFLSQAPWNAEDMARPMAHPSGYAYDDIQEKMAELLSAGMLGRGGEDPRRLLDAVSKRYRAAGGDVPPGTYIVNEIGRELFVPRRSEHLIPPEVAEQIPGGGLLARINAQRQAQAEPWKPAWMRRGMAKDLTGQGRAGGGPTEIPGHGPMLWQAPEDGWIVPNRLMGRVPRAADGRPVFDALTGRYRGDQGRFLTMNEGADRARRETEAQRIASNDYAQQQRVYREARAQGEANVSPLTGPESLLGRIDALQDRVRGNNGRRFNAVGARTPRTFIGAVIGRGVTEKATEQLQEAREFLQPYRRALPRGVQPEDAIAQELERHTRRLTAAQTELSGIEDKRSKQARALKTEIEGLTGSQEELLVHQKDVTQARHEEEDAIKNLTGPRALTRQFVTLTAGFTAYQLALEGFSKAMQIGAVTAQPMIDRLTGFSMVADSTTKVLAQSSRELGGNVQAAIARAAPAVGAGGLSFLQGAAPGITARAGAGSAQDTLQLFRTALAFRSGAAVPGVFQGQGGLLGGPILAEQLGGQIGIGEVLSRGVGDFQSAVNAFKTVPQTRVGEGVPGAGGRGGVGGRRVPDLQAASAGVQGLAEWTSTFNEAAGRAVEIGGAQATGLKLVSAETAKMTEEMYKAAPAFAKFGDYAKGTGLVLVDANNKVTTSFAKAQQTLLNQSQGFQIESSAALAARTSKELRGGRQTTAFQGAFERNTQIPGQLGLELLANPFPAAETGFKFASKGEESRFRPVIAGIAADQKALMDEANAGLDQERAFVKSWVPELSGQFETALTQIGHYGTQIANLNAASANAQAALANANYINNRRILQRSLADARALRDGGRTSVGADNIGAIQRAEFEIGRAAQQLSMALSQRQINFQTAVAGFQAPGITGQERAARVAEAQLEASYAQRQLNLQRQQFSLEGQAFTVTARRAVVDARAALDLEKQAHDTQLFVLGNQKQIATNQLHLSKAQADATSILNQAAQNQNAVLGVVDARLKLFGGTIEGVMNDIRKAAGLEAEHTYRNAQGQIVTVTEPRHTTGTGGQAMGILFDTNGPTDMTVGEAGRETVAVLRNPRSMDLGADRGMTGGGQGYQIGPIIVTGNDIKSDMDLDRLAMILADKVEARLGTTAKLVGIPQAR